MSHAEHKARLLLDTRNVVTEALQTEERLRKLNLEYADMLTKHSAIEGAVSALRPKLENLEERIKLLDEISKRLSNLELKLQEVDKRTLPPPPAHDLDSFE